MMRRQERQRPWWARAGRWAGLRFQKLVYRHYFTVRVHGREHAPHNGPFIIAANHGSHLDMGLIKHALGYRELVSLAAKDYFFDDPLRRWFFSNFTNLLPFNRKAALKESLQSAGRVLAEGRVLVLFPEGTRTTDGKMKDFKPSLGFLALNNSVPVLPVYLHGVFEAYPKGAWRPRRMTLAVSIGKPISHAALERAAAGYTGSDAYRAATAVVEDEVRRLGGQEAASPRRLAARP